MKRRLTGEARDGEGASSEGRSGQNTVVERQNAVQTLELAVVDGAEGHIRPGDRAARRRTTDKAAADQARALHARDGHVAERAVAEVHAGEVSDREIYLVLVQQTGVQDVT
jgi:hypothetical protein